MSNVILLDDKLPIEKRVEIDMRSMGYDPNNLDDVNEFWEDRGLGDSESLEITTMYGGKKFKVVITPLDEDEDE